MQTMYQHPSLFPSNPQQKRQVIKQGFVYKRGGSGLLAHWKLKYVVLSCSPSNPNHVLLQIFDKRDQIHPPKHEIKIHDATVDLPREGVTFKLDKLTLRSDSRNVFIVSTKHRNFLFCAQTRSDLQDWTEALLEFSQPGQLPRKNRMQPHHPGHDSSTTLPGISQGKHKEIDAMSTFSDDSCYTYSGSVLHRHDSRPGSVLHRSATVESLGHSINETMSFYEEPILTAQELHAMGSHQVEKEQWMVDKRKAPIVPTTTSVTPDVSMVQVVGAFQEVARDKAMAIIDGLHLEKPGTLNESESSDSMELELLSKRSFWVRRYDGIIYQFAVNYDECDLDDIDDAHARTSQELHGIHSVILSKSGLHTPLMCIVDYKGFRVVCYADMSHPTQKGPTLTHELTGEYPRIHEEGTLKLSQVGRYLNLKPHAVMLQDDRRVTVPTGAGVQIFTDAERQYAYATRLYEMFPLDFCPLEAPPSPTKSTTKTPAPPPQAIYQLFCQQPTALRRLRPEFLKQYPHPLCADALTEWSAYSKKEKDQNDYEITRAARYLRETWIPAFVKRLDALEIRPIDSRHLSLEMHRAGVNMRYLGLIAKISKIPYIRDMCCIEMVARAFKYIYRNRMRNSLLHFRAVGATSIEEQIKEYTTTMFNAVLGRGDKAEKFWMDRLEKEIYRKFEYDMEFTSFVGLYRPAIFLALQYHATYDDGRDYRFDKQFPISKDKFMGFVSRAKHVGSYSFEMPGGRNETTGALKIPVEEMLAYTLARHFKSLGPRCKLAKNDASAQALIEISAFYNANGRHEEAKAYAHSACAASRQNSCLSALALAQVIETQAGLLSNAHAGPDVSSLSMYKSALEMVEWHWGKEHFFAMALHDRIAAMYLKAKKPEQAQEFHDLSIAIAFKSLGKHHTCTAGYLVKAGIIASQLQQTEESLSKFTEAMHIYQSLHCDKALVAEIHYHLADALAARGDIDGAISHSQRCKSKREQSFGQHDPRTIEAYQQLSRLLLSPYKQYKGVLTPQVRRHYAEAIHCFEKIFRYLKMDKHRMQSNSSSRSHSRQSTAQSEKRLSVGHHRSASMASQMSVYSIRQQFVGKIAAFSGYLLKENHSNPTAGPFWSPPYSTTTLLPKSVLHQLTKDIVTLKLQLVENPKQRECVRMIRQGLSAGQEMEEAEEGALVCDRPIRRIAAIPEDEARQVILQLAAVSPSIYLDGILARIEDDDDTAIDELSIVIQLTESETVGLS